MPDTQNFQRTIGLSTAISIVIGGIIGSGIFMRPAEMAGLLGSPFLIILAWILAGIFTLFSMMVLAEIGGMIPATGGQYVFMQHMYGDFWAYLYGWANFAAINTASVAGITFIFAQYAQYFFKLPSFSPETAHAIVLHIPVIGDILPLEDFGTKMLTLSMVILFSFISYRSTKLSGAFQVVFTTAKVLAIVLLVGGLFFSGKGSFENFTTNAPSIEPVGFAMIIAMVAACNGALQAYDGAYMIVYVAGEVRNPGKILPRSLLTGVAVCIVIYVSITAAMMYVLPVQSMASSSLVAADATRNAFGVVGGGIIAILICLSVLGATSCSILSSPRITYAMAREKNFFSWARRIHPKYNTPSNAILLHLFWTIPLIFSGSFYILADMYIFIVFVFNIMLVYGLFILRKKMPDAERPYKVWGYPWMPILVLLFNAFYLVVMLYNDINNYITGRAHIINSVFGLALCALGIPLYWYFKRQKKQEEKIIIIPANDSIVEAKNILND
jgi:basic amino acid/polyamine antiporter, APA family